MTTQNQRLRALLKEARDTHGCHGVCVLECVWSRIDAALAEPVDSDLERSPLAPGEGTWSVFAMKVRQERNEAWAEIGHWKEAAKQHAENHTAVVEEYFRMESERDEARAQRDEADSAAHLAESKLREIVELVGEGGDGTAFGSVESILMAHKHVQEILRLQRDEARAEVERLRRWQESIADGTGYILRAEGQGGYEAADPETIIAAWRRLEREADAAADSYRRGAEAMREAAARELDRLLTERKATAIWVGPDEIRALPVPEDTR